MKAHSFHTARWLSWLERRPVTAEVVGSNPIRVVCPQGYILIRIWDLSSAGRASALQAEGHRFEPYRSHYGWIPEWPKGTDCKSAANCFGGSNPPPPIHLSNIRCKKLPERPVFFFAGVAELADAQDLKSCGTYTPVSVRFRSPAL